MANKVSFLLSCTYVSMTMIVLLLRELSIVETATTRFYDFNVEYTNVNKLCQTKRIVTVNGKFPGPTIYAQEGDRVIVRVKNSVDNYNVSVHWHGVRQLLSCWFDGPAYITQCPIRPGKTFTYEFTLHDQRGTFFWHAHVNWLRATVHGALIIYPKTGVPYPFPTPYAEHVIVLGEYWLKDTNKIEAATLSSGGGPPNPDAYLINGHPGPRYACSTSDVHSIVDVIPGHTYMLRIINAALNNQHFFTVAQHKLTVVEADGEYTQPYTTDAVLLTPGQTLNVLVTADQFQGATASSTDQHMDFLMGMSTYISNPNIVITTKPALAIWRYKRPVDQLQRDDTNQFIFDNDRAVGRTYSYHNINDMNKITNHENVNPAIEPKFPETNDTAAFMTFSRNIRSFPTVFNRVPVPRKIQRHLFFTIGINEQKCANKPPSDCQAPNGGRFAASINNISFRLPDSSSLLQSYYEKNLLKLKNININAGRSARPSDDSDYNDDEDYVQSSSRDAASDYSSSASTGSRVYTTDFPDRPTVKYDYVGNAPNQPPNNTQAVVGTKVNVIEYDANVQIILQNTGMIIPESHPIHLHGFSFYVVGLGSGDYDPALSATFNLDDPPLRNTIAVPAGGWAAIRFKADNPGVWHLHCHLEIHTSWGLGMAFIVKNGIGSRQTLPPPPSDLPQC